uniref:Uncharacterized protein n=1 Tax=Arundo donax TaxID=35708 RepID=A0A0A9BNE2_ARUDO
MKWRILLHLPSYQLKKQTKIIITCMALHKFIGESNLRDDELDMCDQDKNYTPIAETSSSKGSDGPS